jgi:hypothetical protein
LTPVAKGVVVYATESVPPVEVMVTVRRAAGVLMAGAADRMAPPAANRTPFTLQYA